MQFGKCRLQRKNNKGRFQKKNLEFSRFFQTHPPTLLKSENLGKIFFIILKSFLGNFEQFLKKYFFTLQNVKTLLEYFFYFAVWLIPSEVLPTLCSVVSHNGAANHICMVQSNQYAVRPTRCMVWLTQCPVQLTQSVRPPPIWKKISWF